MILRRFMAHVRDQNWFAVGLDFVIVVFGVFIGFQLTAWNESRNNRTLERAYLERLASDVDESIVAQQAAIDRWMGILADMDYTAIHLRNGTLGEDSHERITRGLDQSGEIMIARTTLATINELTSSGRMVLIQDLEIRRAISDLMASHAESEKTSAQHQEAINVLMNEQWVRWSYALPASNENAGGNEAFDSRFRYDYVVDWDLLERDKTVANTLSIVAAWCRHNLGGQYAHLQSIIRLQQLLKAKLGGDA